LLGPKLGQLGEQLPDLAAVAAVTVLDGGMTYGVLSMESCAFEISQTGARLGNIPTV